MPTMEEPSRYHQFLNYLEDGWQIDPPVFIRPTWDTRSTVRNTYHFVLKEGDRRLLVSVPLSPAVEQFVQEHHLRIDHLETAGYPWREG